jgi:hypothetical protein
MVRAYDVRPEPSGVSPASGSWPANVGRALRETLEAFASQAVSEEILGHALADAGHEAAPETATELEEFARGSLHAEVAAVLGVEVADAVVEGLAPILGMMRRAERPTRVPPQPAATLLPPSASTSETLRPRRLTTSSAPARLAPPTRATSGSRSAYPLDDLRARHSEEQPARASGRMPPGLEAPRPAGGAEPLELAVVTADPNLRAEIRKRFVGRQFAVVHALAALPRARVVMLDTRRAFEDLREPWPVSVAPRVAVLWPADLSVRRQFEALQPHVPRVVCAGEEAELTDVMLLLALQLSPT